TSVYAQNDGSWVDETSPSAAESETGKILLAAEQLTAEAGGVVLRLSALYGNGRLALRDRLLNGTARLPADGRRMLNQIHHQDAVSAIGFLLNRNDAGGEVFNVSDDDPASYHEIFAWLCEKYDRPMPPSAAEESPQKRGLTNKRVCNKKLRALGWRPLFPSFREGYAAAQK
ncbi:MAG: hypothetical protein LBD30_07140, partial [Verrucomicrobiales bacterium]|nr:hypothetical protein [Verrucomicrobiales bacterium]